MSLTAAQRLSNLEAGLIAAQKKIRDLATDEELFSMSETIELEIYTLKSAIQALTNELIILQEVLERIEVER